MAAVPQIEGLTVEAMLELAKTSAAALRHLPDERDGDGLNRKWVADILYTVERAKLEKVIKDAVKARKDRLEEKNNLLVEMRPEFAQAFQNCMNFSCKFDFLVLLLFSGERSSLHAHERKFQAQAHQGRARRGQAGGGGPARRHLGLPHGREAPQAGARRDAGLPAERAEPAPGAAADGQPARERRADDAVQHLIEAIVSEIGATSL